MKQHLHKQKSLEESLNKNQIDKSVSQGAPAGVHLAILNQLENVIGNGIEVEEHADYLKNKQDERDGALINPNAIMHRFYGAVRIDGKTYRIMTLMREDNRSSRGNGIYAYDLQKIELLPSKESSSANGSDTNNIAGISTANILQDVEKSYDKGENLLDESKKSGFSK
ncbi:MAG: hypothetical protein HUJ99_04040 [Bacteroidaceae bacterium]|nr:hypothetical protein [Bacteroidaceae bacterium]